MTEENPWLGLPDRTPYVLARDRESVEQYNRRAGEPQKLDLGLLPFPFLGSRSASIVLLNLNPGIDPDDGARQDVVESRSAYANNLAHIDQRYPFFLLDPAHRDHPGYRYWTRHLKQLIHHAGAEALSRELLVLEWVPYPSRHKPGPGLSLPSRDYTLSLVRAATSRDAVIIGLRSVDNWLQGVPELADYPRFYRLKPGSRRIWITRGNLEVASNFDHLLACLPGRPQGASGASLPRKARMPEAQPIIGRPGSASQDIEADFVELLAQIRSLGDDLDEPRPRGRGSSFAFNRVGCLNFVCITMQSRSVKVETLDQSLDFRTTIHVGTRDLSVDEAIPILRLGYEYGGRRRR